MNYPMVNADSIGWLSEEQMIEVDRVMIEDLHIELIQMMENAGRNLARLTLALHSPKTATVYAGTGGNGGGGLVAARHLTNAGVQVHVALARDRDDYTGVPGHQLDILERMQVSVSPPDGSPASDVDVSIDALIGYSLRGAPRGRSAELIEMINNADAAVVSLDTPSGLNVSTGEAPGVIVQAGATLTLALPKDGLRGSPYVGELYLGDISVPAAVMTNLGAAAPDFSQSPLLHISH